MGRRDGHHDEERSRGLLVLPLVLVLVVAGLAAYRTGVLGGVLDRELPDDPALIQPPAGLDLPDVVRPRPVAAAVRAAPLDAEDVRRAVARRLGDRDLGPHVLASVAPLAQGGPVLSRGTGTAVPASTTKLLTALAGLAVLDPQARFETRVVRDGGRVVLVGGGDPLLERAPAASDESVWPPRADVTTLARRTARALRDEGVRRVRVAYDDLLFSGPAVNPRWRKSYIPDGVVAPVTALWVDAGRPASGLGRVLDPSLEAALVFATELRQAGIDVRGLPARRAAPPDAPALAAVESATVAQLVEHLLLVSDNEAAEVVLRHVGLARLGEGSTQAGVQVLVQTLRDLDVPTTGLVVHDGSGLSRQNRVAPETLLAVLRVAATGRPELRTVVTALPVAGFSGSLANRFDEGPPAARGRVRAKTGTLTGVTSLAGIATGPDGVPLLFALMVDRVALLDTLDAQEAVDGSAGALGACRCGVGP